MHTLLDSLSSLLNSLEICLGVLEERIQDMDDYGMKCSYQWQSCVVWTLDVEVAKPRIHLAMNMAKTMKVVQRRMQEDRLHIARHTTTGGDKINIKSISDSSTRSQGLISP